MAEVVSTGVSHMCDNSTVSVLLIINLHITRYQLYLGVGIHSCCM